MNRLYGLGGCRGQQPVSGHLVANFSWEAYIGDFIALLFIACILYRELKFDFEVILAYVTGLLVGRRYWRRAVVFLLRPLYLAMRSSDIAKEIAMVSTGENPPLAELSDWAERSDRALTVTRQYAHYRRMPRN